MTDSQIEASRPSRARPWRNLGLLLRLSVGRLPAQPRRVAVGQLAAGCRPQLDAQEHLEFTAGGAIVNGWNVSAGLTLLDPTILQSNDVTSGVKVQGNEIGNVSTRSGSLWTAYSTKSGLTLGGGVFVFGDRFTSNDNLVTLPGYTRVDVMASQRIGGVELQLNLHDALDATYYETAPSNNNIMPAAGRNGAVTVRYHFLEDAAVSTEVGP